MTPLVMRHEAEIDLFEAVVFYERQRAGLGIKFMDAVHDAFRLVQRAPSMRAVIYRDIRRARVRRYPYGAYYRVETDRVVVVAVFHARRDPSIWKARV